MNTMNTYQRSSPSRGDARTGANEIYRMSANNFWDTLLDPVASRKRKARILATEGESLLSIPCPQAGCGVHSWLLATANRCRSARLPESEAVRIIEGNMTRQPNPANEVETAVAKAYAGNSRTWTSSRRTSTRSSCRAPVPLTEIQFDPA